MSELNGSLFHRRSLDLMVRLRLLCRLPLTSRNFLRKSSSSALTVRLRPAPKDRARIVFDCRMVNDPTMISSNACIGRHFNMQRKTAFEVLSTGDSVEIHSWLRTLLRSRSYAMPLRPLNATIHGEVTCGMLSTSALQLIARERPISFLLLLSWR